MTENHPRVVFERLFGDGGTARPAPRAQRKKTGSILDSVAEEANRLAGTLGNSDRSQTRRVSRFGPRNREAHPERRKAGRANPSSCPTGPSDIPDSFEEHTKLMFDLQIMAFRADMTRVFSLIMARELSGRTYPIIGVPEQHHLVSHHRDDPELMSQKARIDTYHVQLLAYFLEKMRPRRMATARCWITA